MSFENFEEGRNNLGKRPEFLDVEELAVDPNLTPDEMVMASEDLDKEKAKEEARHNRLNGIK